MFKTVNRFTYNSTNSENHVKTNKLAFYVANGRDMKFKFVYKTGQLSTPKNH